MSYGYDSPGYAGYGGYDDSNGYEPYPDHAESAYYEPDPTPSEPYYHEAYDVVQYHDDANYGHGTDERWETEHETYEREVHEPEGFEYGEGEVYEHTGLVHDDYGRGHEYQEPGYDDGDEYGHDDDDDGTRASAPADYDDVEPPILCWVDPTDTTPTYVHPCFLPPTPSPHAPTPRGRDSLRADQRDHVTASNHAQATREPARTNHNTHDPTRTEYSNTLPHSPVTLPEAPCLTPAPKPPIRPPVISPAEYYLQDTGYTNTPYRPPVYIPNGFPTHYTFPPMSDDEHDDANTTFLEQLRRECDEGTQNAIYFAEDIWDFMENCQHEEAEYKADRLMEIRSNHSIQYPKRDYLAVPRSWDTFGEPGNGLPHTIEGSRPIRPALKRRRYRNARTPCYHVSQPRPPRVPRPPPDLESNTAPGTPSPPTMRSNKHHVSNRTPKPTYHVNSSTSPYSTSRLRPPPWPNKHPTRNGNQHQENGRHTPARNTVGQRPPPRPNIPTSPILSIANSCPPPWPNIRHCHHRQYSPISATPPARPPPWPIIPRHLDYTLHNRQNAKRRIKRQAKAKSRLLSEHN